MGNGVNRRFWAAGLVLALAAGGCTPHSGEEAAAAPAQQPAEVEPVQLHSALGAYLAGRFAQSHGDSRAAADFYSQALAFDSDNTELLSRTFTLSVAEGRIDESVPLAERLLAQDPEAPVPLLVMGVRDVRDGRYAQAEKRFAALPKKGVTGFLGPLATAWSRQGAGRTDAALEALAPLANSSGLAPLYEFHTALLADLAGRPADADKHYQTALASQLSIRTIEAAGSFYQRTNRAERARDLYARYLTEHPESQLFDGASLLAAGNGLTRPVASAQGGLAEALFDTGTLMRQGNANELALVFVRLTLALDPNFALAQMLVADVLTAQGRLTDANEVYRALAPNSPVSAFGRLRIAINLDEAGDVDGAVKELRALTAARPDYLDAPSTLGDLLRRHKRFDEAAKAYDQVIARVAQPEERHWSLYFARGIALDRSNQWTRAETDLLKALELKPDNPDALNYLGYSWVDRGMNLDKARAMIEKAVQLRPTDGAIVDSLGWALYKMNDYGNAVRLLERAIELKPEDPTINEHLGDAFWQVGRDSEARFQWRRALTLDPEPEQIEPIKAKLDAGMPGKRLSP